MFAAPALPTLVDIENWETSHLDAVAKQAAAWREKSVRLFSQHVDNLANPGGTDWDGQAAEAAYDRGRADLDVVHKQAFIAQDIEELARRGRDDIARAKRKTLEGVQEARDAGFTVNKDLSLTDARYASPLLRAPADRAQVAKEHAEFITYRAMDLVATDTRVGQELTTKAAELESIRFEGESTDQHSGAQMLDDEEDKEAPPPLLPGPELSESRRAAVRYAEKWADGYNPEYESLGGGDLDCANFASQVMHAGGFEDVGNGIDDWRRGDSDDWYYQNDGLAFPGNTSSKTWTLAKENHNFVTQHSGRGEIVGVVPTPSATGLDPLAPSKAGLLPGDLIYYKDADGQINHVSVYVGQAMVNGVPTDVINQHSGGVRSHDDWMPDSGEYTREPAQAEFVRLRYPGE